MKSQDDDLNKYRQDLPYDLDRETEEDRFELLSAYIDGETTVEERQLVQQWLDRDPETKKIYLQLLNLQNRVQSIPVLEKSQATTELCSQVFDSLDRDRHRRRAWIWGSVITASLVGMVSGFNSPALKFANSSANNSEPIMAAIALNQPMVTIPKAAVSPTPATINLNNSLD